MARSPVHRESHALDRIGWLRAGVLGANDGIVSTASLIVGVASASMASQQVLVTGVAGLVAGALSMAAGEYVSVSSQADAERQNLECEKLELSTDDAGERAELAAIYEGRGLDAALAREVAAQLMAKDALGAHARDELGLTTALAARPIQAAITSAMAFATGAALPLLAVVLAPANRLSLAVMMTSIAALALLGMTGARLGKAPVLLPTIRVVFWGAVAMAGTALIGRMFGALV
ncbi:membrane protein [Polymorphobacter glacialis]|uniref:Membrane protein n=1 Tax=Sandarakinorhabdus glacialis TaxID=1614636 RepID=A0A916ZL54_9SPHN|nr:VIT family protein [Polymorphobacter glacialis]GGE01552.1 membrane protein [Polymorphobacter glacialis]